MANETKLDSLASLPVFDNPLLDQSRALVPLTPLDQLTREICANHAVALKHLGSFVSASIAAGEALIKAKETVRKEVGHGAWEDYVAVECRLTMRTAQNYMKLAREKDKLSHLLDEKRTKNALLTQTEALRILRAEKKKG